MAALSIDSAFAPSSERMTATASNNTEGVPASCPSAASIEPSASFAPPTYGGEMDDGVDRLGFEVVIERICRGARRQRVEHLPRVRQIRNQRACSGLGHRYTVEVEHLVAMPNQIFDNPFAGQPASARDNHSLGHASHSLVGESRFIYQCQSLLCRSLFD